MSTTPIKYIHASTIIIGALKELMDNRTYAYISTDNPAFSSLEKDGKEFVISLVESVLPLLVVARTEQLTELAEEIVLKKLSK